MFHKLNQQANLRTACEATLINLFGNKFKAVKRDITTLRIELLLLGIFCRKTLPMPHRSMRSKVVFRHNQSLQDTCLLRLQILP